MRLALAPEFASHWLAQNLTAFRAAHPQIELEVLVGTRQRNLARRGGQSLRALTLLTYTASIEMRQQARWFQSLRMASPVSLTTNSTHALLAAGRAGAGIAVADVRREPS